MDDRLHLHDGERLLVNLRAAQSVLIVWLLRAVVEAAAIAVVLSILAAALGWFVFATMPGWYAYAIVVVISYGIAALHRWHWWRQSTLRVTTDRILLHRRTSFFAEPMATVKWNQYQESFLPHRNPLDVLLRTRGICIRYGTADAEQLTCFPAIAYAIDLKHYLDKVDSAVRQGTIDTVKPFVLMPKGLRDGF